MQCNIPLEPMVNCAQNPENMGVYFASVLYIGRQVIPLYISVNISGRKMKFCTDVVTPIFDMSIRFAVNQMKNAYSRYTFIIFQ